MNPQSISKSIEKASQLTGKTWPLHSFVTSNPLSGYEQLPFPEAVKKAQRLSKANMYPNAFFYREALHQGDIDEKLLIKILRENGLKESPEFYLQQMAEEKGSSIKNIYHSLDRIMVKWLSAFLDEGMAEWQMPFKKDGFYAAWRKMATYDDEIGIKEIAEIPESSMEALLHILKDYSEKECVNIFSQQLAALPGWTGYIKYRIASNSRWQQEYPITLEDYLAVRLWLGQHLSLEILEKHVQKENLDDLHKLQYLWLKAWEASWQKTLMATLKASREAKTPSPNLISEPEAQLVFCIDTRSEHIRRHVEAAGNYETFGYAGFFGIAMDYEGPDNAPSRKSCPPIVPSAFSVTEKGISDKKEKISAYKKQRGFFEFGKYLLKRLKNMLPSAFGYVEGSGLYYGLSLLARSLAPAKLYRLKHGKILSYENIHETEIHAISPEDADTEISIEQKATIVKSAFELTGWENFAPLVLFVGHGSHTANNPFGSSLDCGACAGSKGRHNARMLAKLANSPEVRKVLDIKYNIVIPENTLFIGAEHNTTTDEIITFDAHVPKSRQNQLHSLKLNLLDAQKSASQERLNAAHHSVIKATVKANDWAETRPEWGLAKNASFIIAPRTLTKDKHLESRCFLHSYNWKTDTSGKALETIMQGPMVVTQWINNHYYFSTVDNANFGGGTKITHNITGKHGVVQGNGGDLKMGLPLQSVCQTDDSFYHQPLRLSVLIQAPASRVTEILLRNQGLKSLIDNEWIYLMVMDPLEDNHISLYKKGMEWTKMEPIETIIKNQPSVIES